MNTIHALSRPWIWPRVKNGWLETVQTLLLTTHGTVGDQLFSGIERHLNVSHGSMPSRDLQMPMTQCTGKSSSSNSGSWAPWTQAAPIGRPSWNWFNGRERIAVASSHGRNSRRTEWRSSISAGCCPGRSCSRSAPSARRIVSVSPHSFPSLSARVAQVTEILDAEGRRLLKLQRTWVRLESQQDREVGEMHLFPEVLRQRRNWQRLKDSERILFSLRRKIQNRWSRYRELKRELRRRRRHRRRSRTPASGDTGSDAGEDEVEDDEGLAQESRFPVSHVHPRTLPGPPFIHSLTHSILLLHSSSRSL